MTHSYFTLQKISNVLKNVQRVARAVEGGGRGNILNQLLHPATKSKDVVKINVISRI